MLFNPSPSRRVAGRLMVLTAVAVALPLTATRAIDYVDVPAPKAPEAPEAPSAPAGAIIPAVAQVAPVAPVAPVPPTPPVPPVRGNLSINGDTIHINGQVKRWSELTPAEKEEVRRSIAQAKEQLARTRIDRGQIQRSIRDAMAHHKVDMEELRRDMAETRAEIDRAMREVDANAAEIRRSGQDPEAIKATIRASLQAVAAIDVEAITRQAMASVDPAAIEASLEAAEASIEKAQDEVERIEERLDEDDED